MPIILETTHFIIKAYDKPHQDRDNGGHVAVLPKKQFEHIYQMPTDLAAKFMQLLMITEEAVITVMRERGIPVVRSNLQINVNWPYIELGTNKPLVHAHLYFRTWKEKHPTDDDRFQAFPQALVFPPPDRDSYYDRFKPLNAEDIKQINSELLRLLQTEKYKSLAF